MFVLSFAKHFIFKGTCQQFQAVYVEELLGLTSQAICAQSIAVCIPALPQGIALYYDAERYALSELNTRKKTKTRHSL